MSDEKETTAVATAGPTAGPPLMPAWPVFTCISCDDAYPATSFKRGSDGSPPTPQLKGHFLPPGKPGTCICNTCIRAHYEMLRAGTLGTP